LQFVDSKGNTALHLAAIEPKPKTMKYLLEQGLNSQLEVENAEGKTPIEVRTVAFLFLAKAHPNRILHHRLPS
jgi:ankyrin repeat protein